MSIERIQYLSKKSTFYEDLYDIIWKIGDNKKIVKDDYHNLSIGLFNTPCAGFGDIIVCKSFYDYLNQWYPTSKVSICTTSPQKYDDLGIKGNIYKLYNKYNNQDSECIDYHHLILKKKIKFDIIIIIPIINKSFQINTFKKLIPYANVFNTFTISEYNGEFPPYTFPIGVGKGQLGLFFHDFKRKKQNLIKGPYALVYIQPSPEWGVHSRSCFKSYLEMICKLYSKKNRKLQMILPEWIINDINESNHFYYQIKNIISRYYDNWDIIYQDKTSCSLLNSKNKNCLTFRGDILPQKREIFISLMEDSIKDILVTGDQSLTDVLSCCKNKKRIWYQIAPWKKGLAFNLSKELPNHHYSTFKTSCGSLKSINNDIKWINFLKKYDFRIKGKQRMDNILKGTNIIIQNIKLKNDLIHIIENSRFLETAQKKINKLHL